MFVKIIACLGFCLAVSVPAMAKEKEKEIRFVIQYAAGGSADRIARVIEKNATDPRFPVRVEYKVGSGGLLGFNDVASVKTPGRTTIIIGTNSIVTLPVLESKNVNYDLDRDYQTVGYIGGQIQMIAVTNKLPIKNWRQFVAYSKNNTMPYGSTGQGGSTHIASALIAHELGGDSWIHIPYKSPPLADLISGDLAFVTDVVDILDPLVQDNKLTPVAVINSSRISKYAKVPTLTELGINDHGLRRWYVLLANSTADPEAVEYMRQVLSKSSTKEQLAVLGIDTSPLRTDINKFLGTELTRFKKINSLIKVQ